MTGVQVRRDQPRGNRRAARAQSTTHWCTTRPSPLHPDTKMTTRMTSRLAEQPREPSTIRTVPATFLWTDSASGHAIVLARLLELPPVSPVAGNRHHITLYYIAPNYIT